MHLLRKGTDPGDPYSFSLYSVDLNDTGLYSCVAGNILGETVETAYLLISQATHYKTSTSKMLMTGMLCTVGRAILKSGG